MTTQPHPAAFLTAPDLVERHYLEARAALTRRADLARAEMATPEWARLADLGYGRRELDALLATDRMVQRRQAPLWLALTLCLAVVLGMLALPGVWAP